MNVSRSSGPRRSITRINICLTTLVLAIGATSHAASASATSPDQIARLDTLVFRTSLTSFTRIAARPSRADSSFDWSTDHCSAPLIGSTGRSFDFTTACARHDFAYRNFKRMDATNQPRGQWWNSRMRHRIDLQFQRDMNDHCSRRGITERAPCRIWAETFYRLVRIAAGP